MELAVPRVDPGAFVAPTAGIFGRVVVEPRAVVMFGVVIRAEFDRVVVGEETNVQDVSVLHCDEGIPCLVGRRVTIGHAAVVHGATVGDHALIGIGARVLNRATIGEGAWVASGSVVAEGKHVPPWTLAVGVPARPTRELREDEIRRAEEGVDHYLELADAYRRLLASPTPADGGPPS